MDGAGNVIPGEANIRFNIRFRSPLTRELLQERLAPLLTDPEVRVEVEWSGGSKPYDSKSGALRQAVLDVLARMGAAPSVARDGGTSDGRFVAEYGAEVVELGPCNETIHKVDEGLAISELTQLVGVYYDILGELAARWR